MEEADLERKSGIDFELDEICDETRSLKRASNHRCIIDINNSFLKTEILSQNPEVFIAFEVYNEDEINFILKEARQKKLMHMFEIYKDYLDDLHVESINTENVFARTHF